MMKKTYRIGLSIASAIILTVLLVNPWKESTTPVDSRSAYEAFLREHPYNNHYISSDEWEGMPKTDRPDLAWEQNYLMTMDPSVKRPTPDALLPIQDQVRQVKRQMTSTPGAIGSPWVERGPNNVAGRVRALMFDPNDPNHEKVWAGSVGGGLWYNNDITVNSSWQKVDDFWDNLSISSIASDPNNSQIFYVGTGESFTANGSSTTRGAGVWKTTNGGNTWSQLSSTTSFFYVNDLVVRNESGTSVLYVAVDSRFDRGVWHPTTANQGLYRSTNGGTSFTQVLPDVNGSPYAPADIEIGADNHLWVGSTENRFGEGGGTILNSPNGTTWSSSTFLSQSERVELATAPSNANWVYALLEKDGKLEDIVFTDNKGGNWYLTNGVPEDADNGIPDDDFTRGQAWYDLILAVDPNDHQTVIAGGIDLFRTTNNGDSWDQISKWSNNNNLSNLNCSFVHADQHAILYVPGSSNEVIFGNDGGVYYTNNVSSAEFNDVIEGRLDNHNITQFYACAIHPDANENYFLAGSQDNGTQQFNDPGVNGTFRVIGGDGAYCFIDQTDPTYQVGSFIRNVYLVSDNGGGFFNEVQNDQSTGLFINPADYDDNLDVLYSSRTDQTINRIRDISSNPFDDFITFNAMGAQASHFRVSPYTTTSSTVFLGTQAGKVFKLTNMETSNPGFVDITDPSFPNGNVSCIEIGANEDELIVTFSNYGVVSVWYTDDGGTNWSNKEGNLPNMPVRWALFNPNDRDEVILATEVGVWSTDNFKSSNPTWQSSVSGLANVRVDMLQIRDSDNEVIAATHGRGLFSSDGFNSNLVAPDITTQPTSQTVCENGNVMFTVTATGTTPLSYQWKKDGNDINGAQNSSYAINSVSAADAGQYTCVVSNAAGMETSNAATLTVDQGPNITNQSGSQTVCSGTDVVLDITANSGSAITYQWFKNGNLLQGENQSTLTLDDVSAVDGGDYFCELSNTCGSVTSGTITLTINTSPVVNLGNDRTITTQENFVLDATTPGGTYLWHDNSNQPTFTVDGQTLGAGTHTVFVAVTVNGCVGRDTIIVTVSPSSGINELNGSVVSLYPNPTRGQVTIDMDPLPQSAVAVSVMNINGQLVLEKTFDASTVIQIDLSDLAKGTYLVRLQTEEGKLTKQIILE